MKKPMKKTVAALLLLIAAQGVSIAQFPEIEGVWNMYETSFAGEPEEVSVTMTFTSDGRILLGGQENGSWKLNQAESTLTIESDLLMTLEGDCALAFNKGEMYLTNPEEENSKLRRLSLHKDQEYTNELVGEWEVKKINGESYGGEKSIVIDYNKNGIIYQRGIVVGTWKYDKKAQTIIQNTERSDSEEMNGEAKISQLDDEKLIFKLNGVQLNLQKAGK
jgi:hypothetical protein